MSDVANDDTEFGGANDPANGPNTDPRHGGAPDGATSASGAETESASATTETGAEGAGPDSPPTVEDLLGDLEAVTAERDTYLDNLRRLQAEFENYRKAVAKREVDARERANEHLVGELLPVLDACDGAVTNGAADVAPVRSALLDSLAKQGLERIDEAGAPFDPEQHEAVMHEPADDGGGPVVAQLLRVGYRWKGRVIRPAMVQVKG